MEREWERRMIATMFEDWKQLGRSTGLREERSRFVAGHQPTPEDFGVWIELDAVASRFVGLVHQIANHGRVVQPLPDAIRILGEASPFAVPPLARFWAESRGEFPLLARYCEMLDHLRLLAIQYLGSVDDEPS